MRAIGTTALGSIEPSDALSGSNAGATFDFAPSNLGVNHSVSPVTQGLSEWDRERRMPWFRRPGALGF